MTIIFDDFDDFSFLKFDELMSDLSGINDHARRIRLVHPKLKNDPPNERLDLIWHCLWCDKDLHKIQQNFVIIPLMECFCKAGKIHLLVCLYRKHTQTYRESQKKVYTKNKLLSITNLNFYHSRRVHEKICLY